MVFSLEREGVIIGIVLFLISMALCSSVERRIVESDNISPDLLRVRIAMFERRARQLLDELATMEEQAEGRVSLQLAYFRLQNSSQLAECRRRIAQMRYQLRQIDGTEELGTGNNGSDLEANRTAESVHPYLYFQTFAKDGTVDEEGFEVMDTDEESSNGMASEGKPNEACAGNRSRKDRFESVPEQECSICLDSYKDGDTVAWAKPSTSATEDAVEVSTCSHLFHEACITEWLLSHDQCPMCRTTIMQGQKKA